MTKNAVSDSVISRLLEKGTYALIGAGQLGEMAIDQWPRNLPLPRFVLDSHKKGQCRGIDIHDLRTHKRVPDVVYLLSVFKLPAEDVQAIFARLDQPVLTAYDLFEQYCPERFSNGWRAVGADDRKDKICAARACFADAKSIAAFDAAVAWRYRREFVPEFECEPEDSKYDTARLIRNFREYDTVLDCGSYDFSFAERLARDGIRTARYIAFEPDDRNYARSLAAAHSLAPLAPNSVVLERMALYDHCGKKNFLNLGLLSSRITADTLPGSVGEVSEVCTTTLDEYYFNKYNPGADERVLIKLHIEGAENAALRGAQKLLQSVRPDLFINLSHDEASLLDVPVLLRDSFGYRLRLVGHSLFGEGVTLVASSDMPTTKLPLPS